MLVACPRGLVLSLVPLLSSAEMGGGVLLAPCWSHDAYLFRKGSSPAVKTPTELLHPAFPGLGANCTQARPDQGEV